MLDARPHGKREYFKTVGEAKTRADQLATERENRGTEAIGVSTEDRMMAAECTEQLRPFGKTLRDATAYYVHWLQSGDAKQKSLIVSECVDQYIASRQGDVDRGDLDKKSFYEISDRAKQARGKVDPGTRPQEQGTSGADELRQRPTRTIDGASRSIRELTETES